ncbi:MAG: PqqD family protein [Clostridia bacterium]|nr:PqqD family protein [Clostridia bacterium]
MKLKSGFTIREIAGDYIVVPTGDNYLDFGAVISLNESGAFLWNQLQQPKSADELSAALAAEYGIDASIAAADTVDFVNLLKEHGLMCDE